MSEHLQPDQPPKPEQLEVHRVDRLLAAAWPPHTHLTPEIERTARAGLRVIFGTPEKKLYYRDTLYYPN